MRVFALMVMLLGALSAVAQASKTSSADFSAINRIMADALEKHQLPGAVVLVGHDGKPVFEKAYGMRALEPEREAMTADTVFDMASLTKILATSTSVMELYEQGLFRLNDPVAKYLPEFAANGKQDITIRQLMTHYSGLAPDLELKTQWSGRDEAYRKAFDAKPVTPAGVQFRYSDINFIVLGALVEKLSGETLDEYALKHVFQPLGMRDTRFLPPASEMARIAPTQYDDAHGMLRGVVHDPTSRRMGGVAGHAGVFSTVEDVSRYAQALLDRLAGRPSDFPLKQETLEQMVTPQQPANGTAIRGLGWDIESPFSGVRGELFPVGSFGHTGFTGTSLWIDPSSETYVILLANAVHPNGGKPITPLRGLIATAAARAVGVGGKGAKGAVGLNESFVGRHRAEIRNAHVLNGIDVLEADQYSEFKELASKHGGRLRLGILTNQTGLDASGRRTIDVLAKDAAAAVPGLEVKTLFSPEHGIAGALDTEKVGNSKDVSTGLLVISLYGAKDAQKRPSKETLQQLDAVVIDLQDAGVHFYTYEAVMMYFLEAAAGLDTEIVVLDRPNPIGGLMVQGPITDADEVRYTSPMPLPVRHGMTLGELARYANGERKLGAKLTVVPMRGWQRGDWFDATGQLWVNPSPNLRSLRAATVYPGLGMIETSNVSVGRGTDTPFERIGAPWIDSVALAQAMNMRFLPGVRFVPVNFTPSAPYPYASEVCGGVEVVVTDREVLDSPELGLELAAAIERLYPAKYELKKIETLMANKTVLDAMVKGVDPQRIAEDLREPLDAFEKKRARYLLY